MAPGSTKPNTPLAPRHERFWLESSAPTCACHAAWRSSSVSEEPTEPPRTPPRAAPVGMTGEGMPAGAGATVDAAAPAGVVEPVTAGASLEPTLWQPASPIEPIAIMKRLNRIDFILPDSVT